MELVVLAMEELALEELVLVGLEELEESEWEGLEGLEESLPMDVGYVYFHYSDKLCSISGKSTQFGFVLKRAIDSASQF